MKHIVLIILSVLVVACNNQSSKNVNGTNSEPHVIYGSKKVEKKVRRAVQVMGVQKFHLNSQAKIGGKEKITHYIKLPKNTIEWYYSVVTGKGKTTNSGVNLHAQLGGLLNKTQFSVNNIKFPSGTSICDIYLMDRENRDRFMEGEKFSYNMTGSRENFVAGVIQLENIPEYCYLGFKNPQQLFAIDVALEVVAIVEE